MVIPEERDGKSEAAVQLARDPTKPSNIASTRKAGGRETEGSASRKVMQDFGRLYMVWITTTNI